ncbi:hypothetical protein [Litorisediminicola beolgyonensis]|uniref:Ca-activated chloride channel family protein n=1 Tax=Litorisediminicola beolgyonensis TaxID=1173614 RepID=A0ABW3ZHD0_9RHOB
MRGWLLIAALVSGVAAGPEAWGKLAWQVGLPAGAASLARDPSVRAAALYAQGQYAAADRAFADIGRSATYNRGLTLAATGDHALSVAYFDAVLFADRYDAEARHNRDLVKALVPPVIGDGMGHGRIEALLKETGMETTTFDPDAPHQPIEEQKLDPQRSSLKRPVTGERSAVADDAWLDALEDAPSAYLAARLAAEMERRRDTGEAHPEQPDAW